MINEAQIKLSAAVLNFSKYEGKVTKVKSFYISNLEVTQKDWKSVMGEYDFDELEGCGENCPAVFISWLDAIKFANKLSLIKNLNQCYRIEEDKVSWLNKDCEGYRLPTISEWMIAADVFPLKDWQNYAVLNENNWAYYEIESRCRQHNRFLDTTFIYKCSIQKIGQLSPNKNGLYDIYGNVNEWVWGTYAGNKNGEVYIVDDISEMYYKKDIIIAKGCDFTFDSFSCSQEGIFITREDFKEGPTYSGIRLVISKKGFEKITKTN
jgi:formylglycine-generating enzyme required for sulfatase activity